MRKYLLALAMLIVATSVTYTTVLTAMTQPSLGGEVELAGSAAIFVAMAIASALICYALSDNVDVEAIFVGCIIALYTGSIGIFVFVLGTLTLVASVVAVALAPFVMRSSLRLRLRWLLGANTVVAATVVSVLSTTDRTLIMGATLCGLFLLRFIGDLPKAELETKKPGTKPATGS